MQVFTPTAARAAPASTVGALGWLRANLFSSPLNIAITMALLYLLYHVVPPAFRWLVFDATFAGADVTVCKAIVGDDVVDAPGSCWTFIKVRFPQLMFGLYYSGNLEQVWRPILMFALFAALMAPLFVPGFRRKLHLGAFIIFVFPFVAYALVHGEWLGLPVAETDQWGGFMLTFFLAAVGIVGALPLGILFALGRRSDMPMIRAFSVFYIEMWRAAPLITVLYMASNILPLFFPAEVDFDKVVRAMIAITLFQSAYTAEAIRGGLQALDKGQFEAADALGLGYWKKSGFVVLPQALKISIPGIVNSFIQLFKDTTLVLIIGLFDLLNMAETASRSPQWKGYDLEAYIFVASVFFVCCFGMSKYSQSLERKLHTGR